ncbi:MAG TPA: hypothetical protein DCP97_01050 [Ruminococcaceae bacterium]|nr:hypothetical protein [Oscillospiraceae bacterium]
MEYLGECDVEATLSVKYPFRRRSEHIKRVYMWAERILENQDYPSGINKDAVLTAAVFHDAGYALISDDGIMHAERSAEVFVEYALLHNYEPEKKDFISYLIRSHSDKQLMREMDTPIELIVLMEADLLDETGALSIVWDCMAEGAADEQSFIKTYEHIKKYSGRILNREPMVTQKGKQLWQEKQKFTRSFIQQLAYDLGIDEKLDG